MYGGGKGGWTGRDEGKELKRGRKVQKVTCRDLWRSSGSRYLMSTRVNCSKQAAQQLAITGKLDSTTKSGSDWVLSQILNAQRPVSDEEAEGQDSFLASTILSKATQAVKLYNTADLRQTFNSTCGGGAIPIERIQSTSTRTRGCGLTAFPESSDFSSFNSENAGPSARAGTGMHDRLDWCKHSF
ncbi:hypothetical protein B0H10DRAFT_1938519 [Mycena sp. CBHHK59/15]|nr:hypothetical protein B0H10DRAFT_1938519 [Mycena sp. CBHHK59/15]